MAKRRNILDESVKKVAKKKILRKEDWKQNVAKDQRQSGTCRNSMGKQLKVRHLPDVLSVFWRNAMNIFFQKNQKLMFQDFFGFKNLWKEMMVNKLQFSME